jgi:DNA-binding transcriptional LysR family regulator
MIAIAGRHDACDGAALSARWPRVIRSPLVFRIGRALGFDPALLIGYPSVEAMELNQIRYFLALARTLHFTKAAEACNVSQPALTKAIQKLEEELGGALFLRERNHTQLTELGRLMVQPLERAYAATRDAKMQADAFRRREASPLRIGIELSVPGAVLRPVLAALQCRTPDMELTMRQAGQQDLCDRMLAGELDVGLFVENEDMHERLHRWPMFAERYVLICPPNHRFKDRDTVGVPELAEECLLLHEDPSCPLRRFIGKLFAEHGLKPRRQHFANSQEQILEMVMSSLGVSFAGDRLPDMESVLRRPIAADPDRRSILLASVAGRPLGPTATLFLKLMRARAWSQDAPSSIPVAVAA